jgi:hypothetical protein
MSNSNSNFFVDLIKYFEDQANNIQTQALRAGIFSNKSDIGTIREDILFDFLSHLTFLSVVMLLKEDLFLIP